MDHEKPHHTPSHADRRRYYDDSDDHVARVRAARQMAEREIRSFDPTFPYKIEYIHGQRTDIDYSKPPKKKDAVTAADSAGNNSAEKAVASEMGKPTERQTSLDLTSGGNSEE